VEAERRLPRVRALRDLQLTHRDGSASLVAQGATIVLARAAQKGRRMEGYPEGRPEAAGTFAPKLMRMRVVAEEQVAPVALEDRSALVRSPPGAHTIRALVPAPAPRTHHTILEFGGVLRLRKGSRNRTPPAHRPRRARGASWPASGGRCRLSAACRRARRAPRRAAPWTTPCPTRTPCRARPRASRRRGSRARRRWATWTRRSAPVIHQWIPPWP
jgi:hypothetical protein